MEGRPNNDKLLSTDKHSFIKSTRRGLIPHMQNSAKPCWFQLLISAIWCLSNLAGQLDASHLPTAEQPGPRRSSSIAPLPLRQLLLQSKTPRFQCPNLPETYQLRTSSPMLILTLMMWYFHQPHTSLRFPCPFCSSSWMVLKLLNPINIVIQPYENVCLICVVMSSKCNLQFQLTQIIKGAALSEVKKSYQEPKEKRKQRNNQQNTEPKQKESWKNQAKFTMLGNKYFMISRSSSMPVRIGSRGAWESAHEGVLHINSKDSISWAITKESPPKNTAGSTLIHLAFASGKPCLSMMRADRIHQSVKRNNGGGEGETYARKQGNEMGRGTNIMVYSALCMEHCAGGPFELFILILKFSFCNLLSYFIQPSLQFVMSFSFDFYITMLHPILLLDGFYFFSSSQSINFPKPPQLPLDRHFLFSILLSCVPHLLRFNSVFTQILICLIPTGKNQAKIKLFNTICEIMKKMKIINIQGKRIQIGNLLLRFKNICTYTKEKTSSIRGSWNACAIPGIKNLPVCDMMDKRRLVDVNERNESSYFIKYTRRMDGDRREGIDTHPPHNGSSIFTQLFPSSWAKFKIADILTLCMRNLFARIPTLKIGPLYLTTYLRRKIFKHSVTQLFTRKFIKAPFGLNYQRYQSSIRLRRPSYPQSPSHTTLKIQLQQKIWIFTHQRGNKGRRTNKAGDPQDTQASNFPTHWIKHFSPL
ncbi:hypothetical protein VP01_1448g1 [Puccinia sorghi]|uniref:Uncharacterized protein n=1 Tax=Puccinia sorghi TaxID=27349 RepID=A0A0L6VK95_9BASI|nr:hypothetical protein VP01_1448g1 [Puccinia sorghi]